MRSMTGNGKEALIMLGVVIGFFVFLYLTEIIINWIEKDMEKHPGKHKFFEDAWDHYY